MSMFQFPTGNQRKFLLQNNLELSYLFNENFQCCHEIIMLNVVANYMLKIWNNYTTIINISTLKLKDYCSHKNIQASPDQLPIGLMALSLAALSLISHMGSNPMLLRPIWFPGIWLLRIIAHVAQTTMTVSHIFIISLLHY